MRFLNVCVSATLRLFLLYQQMVAGLLHYRTIVAVIVTSVDGRYRHTLRCAGKFAIFLTLDISVYIFHEQVITKVLVALHIAAACHGGMVVEERARCIGVKTCHLGEQTVHLCLECILLSGLHLADIRYHEAILVIRLIGYIVRNPECGIP